MSRFIVMGCFGFRKYILFATLILLAIDQPDNFNLSAWPSLSSPRGRANSGIFVYGGKVTVDSGADSDFGIYTDLFSSGTGSESDDPGDQSGEGENDIAPEKKVKETKAAPAVVHSDPAQGVSIAEDALEAVEAAAAKSGKKIAFLFMTRGHMPMEDIWREFFHWRADKQLYNIYVHAHPSYRFPPTSFFFKKEIPHPVEVKWGGIAQVRGLKALVREALEADPENEWFCLMSETCIPLLPFERWRAILLTNTKSIVNACWLDPAETERESRWRPSLDAIGVKKEHFRKSATWFALNKKHARIFAAEDVELEEAWGQVPCCDEHFLPSLLASHGLDNETTCTDGFCHVQWKSLMDAHPYQYNPDEINENLFQYLQRPVGSTPGFSQQCSGFEEVCHFTARKFGPSSKYALLETLDLVLSTDAHPYTGNPFDHHVDKLRRKPLSSSSSSLSKAVENEDEGEGDEGHVFYLIEGEELRQIPDLSTLKYLHLPVDDPELVPILTEEELEMHGFGAPFPSRKDGMLLRGAKDRTVYYMFGGHKHAIWSLDVFVGMGLDFGDVQVVPDSDVAQIPPGGDIKSVEGYHTLLKQGDGLAHAEGAAGSEKHSRHHHHVVHAPASD